MRQTNVLAAAALATMFLLTACGDARLDKLSLGISKDSAATIIGDPPHREASYLTAGKLWEVQFYARASAGATDTIPWRKMSPVVFIDHKAVGWGWGWWGGESSKQHIAMPER